METKTYIAIDLKSFYASVECMERQLDPLEARLVVADESRTEKTICLAVSPALKAYGIPGRPRLFEVVQKAKAFDIDFIIAPPRMALYIEYSSRIFDIYLKYVSNEDIHVYSIDEVFIDATSYLNLYHLTAKELTIKIIHDILATTGITATAGIGTNLYLAKIAMDIEAKHTAADQNGVRIASLDEYTYRKKLWGHLPLSDFWRIGSKTAKKLEKIGIRTMGDIARCSLGDLDEYYNEDLLYKIFGVNAELLIDHAWGYEPCTIKSIKAYKPKSQSISSGQVLQSAYDTKKARIVVMEMADALALNLTEKSILTDQIVLTIGYDIDSLLIPEIRKKYKGNIKVDRYGRHIPEHAHGTYNLNKYSSLASDIISATLSLYDRIINNDLLVRRITLNACHIRYESDKETNDTPIQLDFFSMDNDKSNADEEKEKRLLDATISIKKRYGKNAILRGTSFTEGATAKDRNSQIGGHKA